MPLKNLISKKELLGGFHGGNKRRATVTLSLIEARAAQYVVEKGTIRAPLMTESAFKERSRAYLGAVAEGAKATAKVSIQNLEASAPSWRILVPENPGIRAELARLISEKYYFSRRHTPQLAQALGMEDPRVKAAFEAQGDRSFSTLFQEEISFTEQAKWTWAKLNSTIENLPPFWTAFALTITETVGAGTLALPIAFATIGPIAGVVLLLVLGIINMLTVAYIAEASARNGSIRYGSAFVGRLVQDYLGTPASILLRISLFAFCCIVLASYYTGFASTVSAVTGLPEQLWVGLIFGTGLFLILRRSLIGTLTSALLIGFVNISILVLLSVVALTYSNSQHLLHMEVPYINGRAFEASHLQLVFGIVLVSYFGHLSVSNCAQAVLRRDPDGKSLKRGTMTAMAVAIFIYSLWSLSVGSAVGSDNLQGQTGTALVPLAELIGPQVYILGVVFAVLALGMSSVHFGLGIFNMSRELSEAVSKGDGQWKINKNIENIASILPLFLVFTYVQWTYFNGTPSFTAPLELLGAILTPVLAGIFPVLLLMASRARGLAVSSAEVSPFASNKLVLGFVVLLSFAGLMLHGLLIWETLLPRMAALATAIVMLILIADLIRRRVFSPLINIEIQCFPEKDYSAIVSVAFKGKAIDSVTTVCQKDGVKHKVSTDGTIKNFRDCHSIKFDFPRGMASKLQINAHRIFSSSEADPLDGWLSYLSGDISKKSLKMTTVRGLTRIAIPKNRSKFKLYVTSNLT